MDSTFKELSAKAAQMEREGNVSAARRCWKKAEAYAVSKANAHWCQVRAEFCLSRHVMPTEVHKSAVVVMEKITEITVAAVRNGEPLESIKDRVLDGLISAALIKNYGSQAAAARQLHVHRDTVRKRCKVQAKAIESSLTYQEAWHHLSMVAVMEAIEICGGNRTLAKDHLKCSKFAVWRYSR